MPKGILEFFLPDEEFAFQSAVKVQDLLRAISEYRQWLRDQVKHVDRENQASLEEAQKKLWEYLNENHVSECFD